MLLISIHLCGLIKIEIGNKPDTVTSHGDLIQLDVQGLLSNLSPLLHNIFDHACIESMQKYIVTIDVVCF